MEKPGLCEKEGEYECLNCLGRWLSFMAEPPFYLPLISVCIAYCFYYVQYIVFIMYSTLFLLCIAHCFYYVQHIVFIMYSTLFLLCIASWFYYVQHLVFIIYTILFLLCIGHCFLLCIAYCFYYAMRSKSRNEEQNGTEQKLQLLTRKKNRVSEKGEGINLLGLPQKEAKEKAKKLCCKNGIR